VVAGRDGWLFLTSELRHLGAGRFTGPDVARASRAKDPAWADPLPAILDFRAQLEHAGIALLVLPIPPKASIVSDALPGIAPRAGARIDAADAAFYEELRGRGIDVLDLAPELATLGGASFCKTDTHWSGAAVELAGARIAARVKALPWYAGVAKERFDSERREVTIDGDLRRMLDDGAIAKETLPLRFVGRRGVAGLEPVAASRESPVLLLGDSNLIVFHGGGGDLHAKGAGLPDQLALELGFAVDVLAARASGATGARLSLARRAGGLAGKRLVVWGFAARELTEAEQGWRAVPVSTPAGPAR
jgi:alginate O-acetyltransferase complex protein AlgJ